MEPRGIDENLNRATIELDDRLDAEMEAFMHAQKAEQEKKQGVQSDAEQHEDVVKQSFVDQQSQIDADAPRAETFEPVEETELERISRTLKEGEMEDAQVMEEKQENIRETAESQERIETISEQIEQEKDPQLEKLEKVLTDTRNLYAETDYRDRTMMYQIRKKLNQRPAEKDAQVTENIEQARKIYEEARANLKNYRLEKIKQGGFEGEKLEAQLRDVLSYFNHQEAVNFYDARVQAKMDALSETDGKGVIKKGWDKLRLGAIKVSEAYKKVPLGVKVGLSLASFSSGLAAVALGKRAFGAFMMATSGQLQFDRLAQKWDSRRNKKEVEKILISSAKNENKEIDIDFLDRVLDEKNSQFNEKIRKHAMRSHVNKYLAFGAAFLGAYGLVHAFDVANAGEVSDAMHAQDAVPKGQTNDAYETFRNDPANADLYKKIGLTDSGDSGVMYGAGGQTPLTDSLEGRVAPGKIDLTNGAGAAAEQAAEHAKNATYTIPKGSSFIGTLNKNFDEYKDAILKTHPQWQGLDRDQITYRMAQEFADRKGLPAGKLPDFVEAGIKMHLNLETGQVELSGGNWGTFEDVEVDVPDTETSDTSEVPGEMGSPAPEPEVVAPVEDVTKPQETVPYDPEHDYKKIETEYQFENATNELNQKYAEAVNPSNFPSEGEVLDEKYAEVGRIDNLRKDVATVLAQMRAEDVPWNGVESVQGLLETGAGPKQILKVSLDNLAQGHTSKLAYWSEVKNQPFAEVAFEDKNAGSLKKGFGAVYMQFKQIIGEKAAQPDIKNNETTGKWLARITRLALEKQANK